MPVDPLVGENFSHRQRVAQGRSGGLVERAVTLAPVRTMQGVEYAGAHCVHVRESLEQLKLSAQQRGGGGAAGESGKKADDGVSKGDPKRVVSRVAFGEEDDAPKADLVGTARCMPLSLFPCGCQLWYSQVVTVSQTMFAYCSSFSIMLYRYDAEQQTWALINILSCPDRIIGISWRESDPDALFAITINTILKWEVETGRRVYSITLQRELSCIDVTSDGSVFIGTRKGKILYLHYAKASRSDVKVLAHASMPARVRVIRSSNIFFDVILTGDSDGNVYHSSLSRFDRIKVLNTGVTRRDAKDKRLPWCIVDIRWEYPSSDKALIGFKNGTIVLMDVENNVRIARFDQTRTVLRSLEWLQGVPGHFITSDDYTGIIREYNVSRSQQLMSTDSARVGC